MFSMHVAYDMHTTLYSQYCDMHVSLNMHGSCMQHAHYIQEISTRDHNIQIAHKVSFIQWNLSVKATPKSGLNRQVCIKITYIQ